MFFRLSDEAQEIKIMLGRNKILEIALLFQEMSSIFIEIYVICWGGGGPASKNLLGFVSSTLITQMRRLPGPRRGATVTLVN